MYIIHDLYLNQYKGSSSSSIFIFFLDILHTYLFILSIKNNIYNHSCNFCCYSMYIEWIHSYKYKLLPYERSNFYI